MPLAFKNAAAKHPSALGHRERVPRGTERQTPAGVRYAEVDEVEDADGGWQRAPTPASDSDDDDDEREVFLAHHRLAASGNILETTTWIELFHRGLVLALRKRFPHSNHLHDREPGIDSRQLFQERTALEDDCARLEGKTRDAMRALLDYVDERYVKVLEKRKELPDDATVYALLWWHFRPGTEVEAGDSTGQLTAFVVANWWYDYNGFRAKVSFRQWTGDAYQVIWTTLSQREFREVRAVADLNFWPLSADRKAKLAARGKVYAENYVGIVHANYSGSFYVKSTVGFVPEPGSGRVITDVASFRRLHPRENIFPDDINRKELRRGLQTPEVTLPEDELFLLPSFMHAFSLKKKASGTFASRFALTLPFHDLDAVSRESIWKSFICRCRPDLDRSTAALHAAGFDMHELVAPEVNGRVIKQTVRTAQALALSAGTPLGMEHILRVRQLGM